MYILVDAAVVAANDMVYNLVTEFFIEDQQPDPALWPSCNP